MIKLNSRGAIDALLIPLIIAVLLFLGAAGFGVWAFMERQDYKDNVDEKIVTAVEIAKQETATTKDNEFIEREKEPLKNYIGPAAFGSVNITYPKTWSAYVREAASGTPVDAYFHPDFVPYEDPKTVYALRVQVLNTAYDAAIRNLDASVKRGTVSATPYRAPKVQDILGVRFSGEIENDIQGTVIFLPLRDKTIKIWTESERYVGDLEKFVLANLTFVP